MSTRNPTVKRILKEAAELSTSPSPDFAAAPLESDLFEWHFTLRGPPSPSPFAGGLYHGRIALPPSYPLRPPSFRFLTPSGRFEVNREICLSISGFHEETWQPAWGIRTALVAIRSFMDSDPGGAVGGLNADEGVRRDLAAKSAVWRCGTCGKGNGEIMEEQEKVVEEMGGDKEEDVVPEELRLGYRDELQGKKEVVETPATEKEQGQEETHAKDEGAAGQIRRPRAIPEQMPVRRPQAAAAAAVATQETTRVAQAVQQQVQQPRRPTADTGTLDKVIYATAGVLVFMIVRFLFF